MICRFVLLALLCSTAAGCFSQSQLPADRAQAAFDRQDYPAAEQLCSEQLSLHPDDFEMLMLRGRSHAMLGRHDSAVADFSRAAELAPNDPEPLYRRQLSYRELGQSALADQDDLAAKSIDPQFGSAYQYDPSTFINRPRGVAARPTQRNGSADEDDIEDDTRPPAEEAVATDRQTDEADADDVAASEAQNRRTRNAADSTEGDGRARHAQDRPRAGTASREPDDLMVIESPRRGSGEPVDELPEDPLTETEGLPDEEPSATRPIISTALPNLIPRGDVTVPIAPSPSNQFPTTGLSPNRSVSEFAPGLPGTNGFPITTGLPVTRPAPNTGLPGSSLPGSGGSPFPGAPGVITTGVHSGGPPSALGTAVNRPPSYPGAIPRRSPFVPGGVIGGTALPGSTARTTTAGTALPGTGPLPPTGPISTALPGTAPQATSPAPVSSALPEHPSGGSPRP